MQSKFLVGTAVCALLALGSAAQADTLVGSITGSYDEQCTSGTGTGSCLAAINNTSITKFTGNTGAGGAGYDTPGLLILNPSNTNTFMNVTITLTGYQDVAGNGGSGATETAGASNPATLTLTLPNIGPNTVYELLWGGPATTSGAHGINLFGDDYDDELGSPVVGGTTGASNGALDPSGHRCGTGSGTVTSICAFVGNFNVQFSALLNGNSADPISSDFGTIAYGSNAFVGWEGLDQDGLSETTFDAHSLTFPGTLAEIFTGTNQNGGGTAGVPEPGTLALIAGGLGALATARRRRKSKKA